VARVDLKTNAITAILPVGPADPEGGITASDDSIWLVTNKSGTLGTLSRIDPKTNGVRQKVEITGGSANPLFHEGSVWITGNSNNVGLLTEVDARTGHLVSATIIGSQPRFLTAGAGAIWTLNQGNGTLSKFETIEGGMNAITTIEAGIPGPGGEICFDGSSVWVSVFDIPLTRIDSNTNEVVRQWTGEGGDAVRFGHGSLWLTGYKQGKLWRIPVPRK
jgi:virginiamycin B lyase